ncbi:sigma-54-dependent Fis family transcriptional regulator [Helicobacter muridarum]|uniref:Sigma-54-dependent Fis family transcriptional regulator n=1 Tax=Helicobacter muridarum TaxID=216 RepID=A0A099U253_9HELI|nr:sigma-54 dependent transcriptional regulator [Helicobacter muridarum]TLE01175.1 sigma-54-dependent Fis family transcriptional regulator [Helicobacter muridarum]STQ86051.1 signal-transduction regulatory protein FlgR [Helicobacter muridarum]
MKIAIVEDDINMRKSLEYFFSDYKDLEITSFKNPKDALKCLDSSFDLIITDINMPQMDGLEFLSQLNGKYEAIVITGNATLNKAIESIRLGVKDFFQKPFEPEDLLAAIYRTKKIVEFNRSNKSNVSAKKPLSKEKLFKSSSPQLEAAKSLALKVAPTDASVLLLGASGVGKEVFARFIHENSKRSSSPFIALNMAAIPEHLLESELFGYEKGAFTDAIGTKLGLLESAQGGTVFLDEIGEMPIGLQAKLLRALQEKEIIRLGSSKPIKIDTRFISATNANIQEKITNQEFREDLFFRLQTVPIKIPPLKDRREEILPLAKEHIKEVCASYGFNNKKIDKDAEERMLNYSWPGNIRELLSVIERACILSEGDHICVQDLYLDEREKGLFN